MSYAKRITALLTTLLVFIRAHSEKPRFLQPVNNLTVAVGREAVFQCVVDNLNSYKLAWVHVERQTVMTLQTHVIIKNSRINVTHHENKEWFLHIRSVQETDRGFYMCQINTDPMMSERGFLDVLVPPDIIESQTSRDIRVQEGQNVTLQCRASGYPKPTITWRREDSAIISSGHTQFTVLAGEELTITHINRIHMGAYLCIASNGVLPKVSKRIELQVEFSPLIYIPNQNIKAPLGATVELVCHIEAFPKALNYWLREGKLVINDNRFNTTCIENEYKAHVTLSIRYLQPEDFGPYVCMSKNIIGTIDGTIRIFEVIPPSTTPKPTTAKPVYKFDYDENADLASEYATSTRQQHKHDSGALTKTLHTAKDHADDHAMPSHTSDKKDKNVPKNEQSEVTTQTHRDGHKNKDKPKNTENTVFKHGSVNEQPKTEAVESNSGRLWEAKSLASFVFTAIVTSLISHRWINRW